MKTKEKCGFIIHPEEWAMVRDVLTTKQIITALLPILDACLLTDDNPLDTIKDLVKTNLCARIFWERYRRDIDSYKNTLEVAAERKRRYKEKISKESTETPATTKEKQTINVNNKTEKPSPEVAPLSLTAKAKPVKSRQEDILVKGGVEEAKKLAEKAAKSLNGKEGESAFFSGEYDAVSIILALTADYGSINRWRQLVRTKGEPAVCEELFTFWREIRAGEDCANRAAALNKRLALLPNEVKLIQRQSPPDKVLPEGITPTPIGRESA